MSDDDIFRGLGPPDGHDMPDFSAEQTVPDQSDLSGFDGSATGIESQNEGLKDDRFSWAELLHGVRHRSGDAGPEAHGWLNGLRTKLGSNDAVILWSLEADLPKGKTRDDLKTAVGLAMKLIDDRGPEADLEEADELACVFSSTRGSADDPLAILEHFKSDKYIQSDAWTKLEEAADYARRKLLMMRLHK